MAVKSLNDWFSAYEICHRHPINVGIHYVAVPAIVVSLMGLLFLLPFPISLHPLLNWATVLVIGAFIFASRLSWRIAMGLLAFASMILVLLWWGQELTSHFAFVMGLIFLIAWIFQFIGHHIEGKRPLLFDDLKFLFIGPLWIIAKLYRRANIRW